MRKFLLIVFSVFLLCLVAAYADMPKARNPEFDYQVRKWMEKIFKT